jgi:hypothetical protein
LAQRYRAASFRPLFGIGQADGDAAGAVGHGNDGIPEDDPLLMDPFAEFTLLAGRVPYSVAVEQASCGARLSGR